MLQRSSIKLLAALVVLIAVSLVSPQKSSAQMYWPPEPYRYWGMWMFRDQDAFHIFWLQSDPEFLWNTIGHAVSKDLLHWKPLPPIPSKGAPGTWDEDPTMTGVTIGVRKPFMYRGREAHYAMFYCSESPFRARNKNNPGLEGQQVGVMFSDDLMHWDKYAENPVMELTPPYYYHPGIEFRDIDVEYDEEKEIYHAYVGSEAAVQSPEIAPVHHRTIVA
jgi:sucrose-6-phosphate hydrolase SacC (GH32 family)